MKKSFIHQQEEISFVKNTFTQYLIDKLDVVEVQGPILSKVGDGTKLFTHQQNGNAILWLVLVSMKVKGSWLI